MIHYRNSSEIRLNNIVLVSLPIKQEAPELLMLYVVIAISTEIKSSLLVLSQAEVASFVPGKLFFVHL